MYVLLVGFSLEILLKAEYMRLNEPSVAEGKLPNELGEHALLALAQLVGFAPTPDECEVLGAASEATISWGGYLSGVRHDKGRASPRTVSIWRTSGALLRPFSGE